MLKSLLLGVGTVGTTLANCLGSIGLGTTTTPGYKYGLAQVILVGSLTTTEYNSPTNYGVIIRFPGYYNTYLCISHNASGIWLAADSGSGQTDNLQWHKLAFETT